MANQELFSSLSFRNADRGSLESLARTTPQTDTLNSEISPAYSFRSEHALAQLVMTGCLNGTFYATASNQADRIITLAKESNPEFVGKLAVYARSEGYMKDTPALLLAVLSTQDKEVFKQTFNQVIDDAKMLRNFVQIMRSGATGRSSLGSLPKRLVNEWLENQTPTALFKQSIGSSPSLGDIIKMVHPKPDTEERKALYGYLIGGKYERDALPVIAQEYLDYRDTREGPLPKVPFQLLDSLELTSDEWKQVAQNASWSMARQNLNTFARHGVFEDRILCETIARRLADTDLIDQARPFPYQLMVAYKNASEEVPDIVKFSLEIAMERALKNVPQIEGNVVICPDVSYSMTDPVTGNRRGSSSSVRCIDVASLTASALLQKNRSATVLPFDNNVIDIDLSEAKSVLANADRLARKGGGGTECSVPLSALNEANAKVDVVIFISDNESWVVEDTRGGTAMLHEWEALKQRNPNAKLICIDIVPNETTQAPDKRGDILNVGGFSDQVFTIMNQFINGELDDGGWTSKIEQIEI
jgi:60 kDa SS-A/Ro ribonucleoprotein